MFYFLTFNYNIHNLLNILTHLQLENYTPLLQYTSFWFLHPFSYCFSYAVPYTFYLFNNLPTLLPFTVLVQFVAI
jgi:hypothetical protein